MEEGQVVDEIVRYLDSCACRTTRLTGTVLDVGFTGVEPALDRIKLEAYVRVWNALHPTARAAIVEEPVRTG